MLAKRTQIDLITVPFGVAVQQLQRLFDQATADKEGTFQYSSFEQSD